MIPHYWLWKDAGQEWAFPHFNVVDERSVYAGRIRALYNGETLNPASQTLACPDEPGHFPVSGEYLTYLSARLFGLGVRGCFILSDFLFPAITFLGFYLFLRALGCSPRLSRLGPLTLLLLDPLFGSRGPIPGIIQSLSWLLGRELNTDWNCSFIYSRMISPEAAMPVLAFACYGTVKALWGGRWGWCILAGVLGGLTASIHFAVGLPLLMGIFLFGMVMLLTRKMGLGRFLLIGLAASIVLAPRLIGLHQFFNHPGSQFVTDRQAVATHAFMGLGYVILMCFFFTPFLLLYKKKDICFGFFLAIIVSNLLFLNLQVLTGLDFGITHYYAYNFLPMVWLGYFAGLSNRLSERSTDVQPQKSSLLARAAGLILCLYALVNGYGIQQAHYDADSLKFATPSKRWLEYQSLGPTMSWLEENASPRDVLVSNPETIDLYTIYSPVKALAQTTIQMCPVPEESYIDRFLLAFKVYGLDWEQVEPIAEERIYDIHMAAVNWQSELWAEAEVPPRLQKSDLLSLMRRHYEALPEGDALDRMLRELSVRYVVFGTFEQELPGASSYHFAGGNYRLCYEAKGHRIFELVPALPLEAGDSPGRGDNG